MTTGKTIALTKQTFVDKVMSLLFNMLYRLVITFFALGKTLLAFALLHFVLQGEICLLLQVSLDFLLLHFSPI